MQSFSWLNFQYLTYLKILKCNSKKTPPLKMLNVAKTDNAIHFDCRNCQHEQLLPEHQECGRAHLLAALNVHQVASADQGQPEPQPVSVRQVAAHLDAGALRGGGAPSDDPGAVLVPRHGVPHLRLQHAPSRAADRHLRRAAATDAPPGAHLRPAPAVGQPRRGIVLWLLQAQLQVQPRLPPLAKG
jgi:hypothetical protein